MLNQGWVKNTLEECARLEYRTTPVFKNGKTNPYGTDKDYKDIEDYITAVAIGLVLDNKVLIDYDGNKTDGIMSVDELAEVVGEEFGMPPLAQAKGDSLHWLYKLSDSDGLKHSADGAWLGVDIKRGNQLMHLKQGKDLTLVPYDELEECTAEVLAKLRGGIKVDEDDLFYGVSFDDTPIESVKAMLSKLDNNVPNSEWVKVGMALHHWHQIDGLALWDEWSIGGDTYKEGECESRWSSFNVGDGVTLGTLRFLEKGADYDIAEAVVTDLIAKINNADMKTIEMTLAKEISKCDLPTLGHTRVVSCLKTRMDVLTDSKIPVATIRSMITPKVDTLSGELVEANEIPKWCNDWVYVNSHAAFSFIPTLELFKSESFNLKNGLRIPMSESGAKQSAFKYVSEKGYINIVSSMAYMPAIKDSIFNLKGKLILNTFDKNSVPKPAIKFTDEGLHAIDVVQQHIKFICGNDEDAAILTQWLAFQVQYQGHKILWSPVIQSIQGVGKSFFSDLLRTCLGDTNVGTVAPSQVKSDFNGWATNVTVNVLEELRIRGHNRHDAVNALKPLITDPFIQINDKGVKPFMCPNTTNYICFTNYKDAIPMDSQDRRWWVIFAEIESLSEMESYTGLAVEPYFNRLFNTVRKQSPQLTKWLKETVVLQPDFLRLKQAPMTDHKLMMISTEISSFEGQDEIKDLIEKGGKYYNKTVISSSDLFKDFENQNFDGEQLHVSNLQKNQILKNLGYLRNPKKVKIDGNSKIIWAKKGMSNSKIRDLLN